MTEQQFWQAVIDNMRANPEFTTDIDGVKESWQLDSIQWAGEIAP